MPSVLDAALAILPILTVVAILPTWRLFHRLRGHMYFRALEFGAVLAMLGYTWLAFGEAMHLYGIEIFREATLRAIPFRLGSLIGAASISIALYTSGSRRRKER